MTKHNRRIAVRRQPAPLWPKLVVALVLAAGFIVVARAYAGPKARHAKQAKPAAVATERSPSYFEVAARLKANAARVPPAKAKANRAAPTNRAAPAGVVERSSSKGFELRVPMGPLPPGAM